MTPSVHVPFVVANARAALATDAGTEGSGPAMGESAAAESERSGFAETLTEAQ